MTQHVNSIPIVPNSTALHGESGHTERLTEPLFLSGGHISQRDSFSHVSFSDLAKAALNPTVGPKNKAAWFAPYIAAGKTKEAATKGAFNALLLDHDDDNLSRDALADLYSRYGMELLAYTSAMHLQTDERHPAPISRWKVVIPFSQGITAEQFAPFAQGAALMTSTDQAQIRLQQVAFMPNKLNDSAPYDWLGPTGAPLLDPLDIDHPFVSAALQAYQCYQQEQRQQAQNAPLKARTVSSEQGGIIDKVNATYSLSEVLESFGYACKGSDQYLYPESTSGIAGVYILQGDDGKKRAFSHHQNDPLADGHAHDVFSVLTILEYSGDQSAAVRFFAETLDGEANDQRRKEEAQRREDEHQQAIQDELSKLEHWDSSDDQQDKPLPLIFGSAISAAAKAPDFLVKDIIERDSHGVIGGASMAFKSFIALQIGYSLATGTDFFGHKTYGKRRVLYIAGEGLSGISRRLKALEIAHGPIGDNFAMLTAPVRLSDELGYIATLGPVIRRFQPDLVILDTFASLSGGIEENSTTEVGAALKLIRDTCKPFGTSTLIVHHFGKDRAKGFRGASNFLNDVDFAISANRQDDTLRTKIQSVKTKDAEPFDPLTLEGSIVPLDLYDREGEECTSLVFRKVEGFTQDETAAGRALAYLDALYHDNDCQPVEQKVWYSTINEAGINTTRARDQLLRTGQIEQLSNKTYRPLIDDSDKY